MIAKIFELTSAIKSVLYANMWYYGSATVSYEKASITEEVLQLPCNCQFLFGPLSRLVVKEITLAMWQTKQETERLL